MFSAAYQQAAVTSRRLLRQPNVAAVMPSAVAALYATCTGYGCSGANKISAESAASALPASIRANGARWPLSAPRRQQQKVRRQEIRQQQYIEIHHRFDTPTSPFCRHATTICAGWRENPRTVGCAKS